MSGADFKPALVELMRQAIAAELATPALSAPLITVAGYAVRWLEQKRKRQLHTVRDTEAHLRLHILPAIGEVPLTELRPHHVRDLVMDVIAKGKAPRTCRHVFSTVHAMCACAVADELIASNPCVLQPGVLPPNLDADPTWRTTALRTRDQAQQIISDKRIPWDRRVLYGLKLVGALRHTEAATLRWSQLVPREPLAAIILPRTKSKTPREVPIHVTLGAMIQEWYERGWAKHFKRAPRLDDLVVPTRNMRVRAAPESQKAYLRDCQRLGLRRGRGHDLRRTFITLARCDGADESILQVVTHGPPASAIMDIYTSFPWEVLCREVAKLQLSRREEPSQTAFAFLHDVAPPSENGASAGSRTPVLRFTKQQGSDVTSTSQSASSTNGSHRRRRAV